MERAREPLALSGFVITRNEAARIEACLRSLSMCAEIVVVDSGSTDATREIVEGLAREGLPVRWIENPWPGFARQKQFALDQCSQPWRLNLDADERVDDELRAALPDLMAAPDSVAAWRIRRQDYLLGYGYAGSSVGEGPMLRLVRADRGAYDLNALVHEGIVPEGEVRDAPRGTILHFRNLPLDAQMQKENAYSTLKARHRLDNGVEKSPWRILFSPMGYFLKMMLIRRYWKAGWAGVVMSMNAAVYAYLTEAKTWEQRAVLRRPPVDQPGLAPLHKDS